jgi:putative peptidoglycan lipid II flippase
VSSGDPAQPLETAPPRSERLARSAGLAGGATLVSRVLGLARETVIAAYFGAGNEMDAYFVAFRIPNLVRDLFAEGAMSAAFVPTFTRYLTLHGKAEAWRLGNNVFNALLLVTGVFVGVAWMFAGPLVTAYAGDFAQVPGKLDLTIHLTRIMLPFLTLAALAAAVMGMLNSLRHYFLPALAPATFNVASIACAVALTPLMPSIGQPRITALAVGAILGGLGQIALQWPSMRREGFRYTPYVRLRDPGLRQVLLLMGPGTLGLAATQVNLLVTTQLATGEGPGAVSWLQYAFRVMYLPIGLFGVSIATAVLPTLSRHLALGDERAAGRTVTRGMALMLLVNIPATVGLLVLATPIVQLLLERGRFLPSDTQATAAAVQCYAFGLIGYSAARIASPAFYALGRSGLAVALSCASIAVNLGLSILLSRTMGFQGLAIATSVAAIVNGGLAVALLQRRLDGIDLAHLAATCAKALIASGVMAWVIVSLQPFVLHGVPGDGTAIHALRLVLLMAAGVLALAVSARLLRIRELDALLDEARRQAAGKLRR